MNEEVILKVHGLKKTFPVKAGTFSNRVLTLKAVDDVSFEVRRGETLGLVGGIGLRENHGGTLHPAALRS